MKTSSAFCFPCKMMEVENDLIRYFDMFAGIGGFRAGLDRAGGFLTGSPQSRKALWGERAVDAEVRGGT